MKTRMWNTKVQLFLHEKKWISSQQLNEAWRITQELDEPFDSVLVNMGLLDEQRYAEMLSTLLDKPRWFGTLSDFNDIDYVTPNINIDFLYKHRMVPLSLDSNDVKIGFANPHAHEAFDYLRFLDLPLELMVLTAKDFELISEQQKSLSSSSTDMFLSSNVEHLRQLAQGAPTVNLVNNLIAEGVKLGASDLHIEPVDGRYRARYRIDGILKEAEPIPVNLQVAVISRIKILCGMDIAEKRRPQDGKIETRTGSIELDIRCSSLPLGFGESMVMRFLIKNALQFNLSELGYADDLQRLIDEDLKRSTGVILMTGPTGSGKTTSLYSFLNKINTIDLKIITLEDPIEYQLAGINQVQVKSDIGFDFAKGLRSILRQDPDVIMVGEIRDGETAKIALQSALTGHLVFSTVHTNDAPTAYTRLLDLGIEEYLLNAGLISIMAQRLVRKLCTNCRKPSPHLSDFVTKYNLAELAGKFNIDSIQICEAVGCKMCENRGYQGRVALLEYLPCTSEVRNMAKNEKLLDSLYHYMDDNGFRNLKQDGFLKAMQGITTVEEVLRVAG
ncbi:type II secretion system protein GspE [Paraglaciecola hydrolytica]|uniref:Type II secretion system protein GspE n=2 Tax=Paraglaciecola hydrolytica TaxID=1799789 RepID=A0A135ZYT6_9ALTE|nr:type II secretion system protein GspE [Paraglaciecola hydrolytica]